VAATVRSTAAFAMAGAAVFLALFGAEGIPAAAFAAAAFGAGVGFFFVTDAAFFVTADAGLFVVTDAGLFVADTGFFVTADGAFFAPRASPGDGVELSRAPAFFLLLAIGAQYTTRRALSTRAGPAACPAAGARGS
jgi:hypothetical protein